MCLCTYPKRQYTSLPGKYCTHVFINKLSGNLFFLMRSLKKGKYGGKKYSWSWLKHYKANTRSNAIINTTFASTATQRTGNFLPISAVYISWESTYLYHFYLSVLCYSFIDIFVYLPFGECSSINDNLLFTPYIYHKLKKMK